MTRPLGPLVRVEWHDAHQVTSGWTATGDLDTAPAVIASVGWIVKHAKPGHITLAQSVDTHGNVDNAIAIPHGMVRRVSRLRRRPLLPVEPPPD